MSRQSPQGILWGSLPYQLEGDFVFLVLLSVQPRLWPLGIGALMNTLMFLFISIPMAEKRLAGYKDGFSEYVAETNRLLPIKRR